MSAESSTDTRTHWGRVRFAGRHVPALTLAVPIGLLLAVGVGAIALWSGAASGPQAPLIAGVFTLVTSWGLVGLVWAIIVDRSSLKGAIDKPEESVESTWMDTAMAGAYRDTVLLTGLSLAAISITGFTLDGTWALIGVLAIAFFSTVVRYLMAKKRD